MKSRMCTNTTILLSLEGGKKPLNLEEPCVCQSMHKQESIIVLKYITPHMYIPLQTKIIQNFRKACSPSIKVKYH